MIFWRGYNRVVVTGELDFVIKYVFEDYEIESIANDDGKNQTLTYYQ
ncbi:MULTISPECIES: hypothetical protein [unclassified Mammaliicoccus]|nr:MULTISPECIES: hypothetical protein [unclassified Mammaliicoccus]